MTPEQKAKEIFEKFSAIIPPIGIEEGYNASKACALICVEEILDLGVAWFSQDLVSEGISECDTLEYWEAVKTELEKL